MIRTRDFILYLCALIFVVLGATYTGVRDVRELSMAMLPQFDGAPEGVAPGAVSTVSELDRGSIIARLREQIARGEGYRDNAPPVVSTFVEDVASGTDETILVDTPPDARVPTGSPRMVLYCGGSAAPYTVQGIEVSTVETVGGVRVLFGYPEAASSTGSTTRPIVGTLPAATTRAPTDTCLPDLLIGVRSQGGGWVPLTNEQARAFTNFSPTTLVGYSRDGFPIYGPLTDSSGLDACGGHTVSGQYQYHIRPAELFVLGCYAGTPGPLTL